MFNFRNYKTVASFRRHIYEGFITLKKKGYCDPNHLVNKFEKWISRRKENWLLQKDRTKPFE